MTVSATLSASALHLARKAKEMETITPASIGVEMLRGPEYALFRDADLDRELAIVYLYEGGMKVAISVVQGVAIYTLLTSKKVTLTEVVPLSEGSEAAGRAISAKVAGVVRSLL